MSDELKNGGPAFPHLGINPGADGNLHPMPTQHGGMTLRDWFAGQALVGMGTWIPRQYGEVTPGLTTDTMLSRRAEWAYQQADAMLSERKSDKTEAIHDHT